VRPDCCRVPGVGEPHPVERLFPVPVTAAGLAGRLAHHSAASRCRSVPGHLVHPVHRCVPQHGRRLTRRCTRFDGNAAGRGAAPVSGPARTTPPIAVTVPVQPVRLRPSLRATAARRWSGTPDAPSPTGRHGPLQGREVVAERQPALFVPPVRQQPPPDMAYYERARVTG
jgi:hypothetical protein